MKHFLVVVCSLVTIYPSYQATNEDAFCVPFQEKNCKEFINVIGTVYWPVSGQTDSSPTITADGSKIDIAKLKEGDLKWVALSRDLLERWGGNIEYGDKVQVTSSDPKLNGTWVVKDTMNSRYSKRIDFLSYEGGVYGKWKDITVNKV